VRRLLLCVSFLAESLCVCVCALLLCVCVCVCACLCCYLFVWSGGGCPGIVEGIRPGPP
jgi:hypothetical protein